MEEIVHLNNRWRNWRFKNTALLLTSVVVFFFLADTPYVREGVNYIGNLGYIGAFITGFLFVSMFTVAPAGVVLFHLADKLNPLGIALAAGTGSVIADYLIYRYLKDRVFAELQPVFMNHGGKPVKKLFATPYFAWAVPIIGAIIVMSPFPDEVGIGLMGISKFKTWQLMGLLYLLDIVGIFLIVIAARSI